MKQEYSNTPFGTSPTGVYPSSVPDAGAFEKGCEPPPSSAQCTIVEDAMSDDQRKYLEMIQSVIARLASHSFLLKGWSVTLATALLGFAGRAQDEQLARLALVPALIFWSLDAYYLGQERRHRHLFSRARDGTSPPFAFDEAPLTAAGWFRAVGGLTVIGLHGVLALLALTLSLIWR